MKTGDKFERLSRAISENTEYVVNSKGKDLLENYRGTLHKLEELLTTTLVPFVKEGSEVSKQVVVNIIAHINSTHQGSDEFNLMSRLDTMTNGGTNRVSSVYSIHPDDKILYYLDKAN